MQEMKLKIDHCTITSLYTHQEMRDKSNRRKLLIPGVFTISKYMYCTVWNIAGLVLLYFSSQIWCHVMWLWLGRTDNILELWHPHHKFRDIRLKYKLFYCVTMFFFIESLFQRNQCDYKFWLSESTLLRSGVMISDFFSVFIILFYNTVSYPPLLLLSKFNVNDLILCPKLEIWLFLSSYKNSGFNFESFVKWSPF